MAQSHRQFSINTSNIEAKRDGHDRGEGTIVAKAHCRRQRVEPAKRGREEAGIESLDNDRTLSVAKPN